MGCDGGTIPKRDELVRTKKKPEQVSKEANLIAKWQHCALSQEPLRPPIVACELGCLFNKESIIEFLLDKSNHETANKFEYIRGLKDVKELQLTVNPAYSVTSETAIAGEDKKISQYICPITGLEMNGRYKFCYLLRCGCVLAERALNEIKDSSCVKCGKAYAPDDVIPMNGSEEDVQRLQEQMEQRRRLAKEMRKSKKEKSGSVPSATATSDIQSASTSDDVTKQDSGSPPEKRQKTSHTDAAAEEALKSRTADKAFSSSGTKDCSEREVCHRGQSKLCSDRKGCISHSRDQEKKPRGIQNDPNASEAYKSLFSSHESAKKQPKAHWITHNPLYY